jgi:hypothetical protein
VRRQVTRTSTAFQEVAHGALGRDERGPSAPLTRSRSIRCPFEPELAGMTKHPLAVAFDVLIERTPGPALASIVSACLAALQRITR